MAEEDNSDQITDSRKQLGGADGCAAFCFWGEEEKRRLNAETLSAQSRSREE